MTLRVNFTDVEDKDFDPIPPGVYTVRVTDHEIRESGPNSKNPGSQYINWEFTISEGEYEGRKQWTNTSLLPQALFSLKDLLKACGYETEGELSFDPDDLHGKTVQIKVRNRTYEGEVRNEVKRIMPVGASEGTASLLP